MTMWAKLVIENNGKKEEFDIEINDPKLQEIIKPSTSKNTGYERVKVGEYYYSDDTNYADIDETKEECSWDDDMIYDAANYYSDKTIAENNARADRLFRNLRRFAVTNRKIPLEWKDDLSSRKYVIYYSHANKQLGVESWSSYQFFGDIIFDSVDTAMKAIEMFRKELTWYFAEYKDSL